MNYRSCSALAAIVFALAVADRAAAETVTLRVETGHVAIEIGGRPFARYVFQDNEIRRPYFADVRTLGGVQVTRHHPPREGQDATDHAAMHPGIWLAFGDISGVDFWRNRGTIRHEWFVGRLRSGPDFGQFSVHNAYLDGDTRICEEIRTHSIHVRDGRVLVLIDSVFTSQTDFMFGDQEEMGLGVRVATPMTVENGGTIRNSDGLLNEAQCWGRQARWAEYAGVVEGRRAGVVVMPHPDNFRASWFHARDYGLLVANPFGRAAFTDGDASEVAVRAGESFRLQFAVCIHEDDGGDAGQSAYETYLDLVRNEPETRH